MASKRRAWDLLRGIEQSLDDWLYINHPDRLRYFKHYGFSRSHWWWFLRSKAKEGMPSAGAGCGSTGLAKAKPYPKR